MLNENSKPFLELNVIWNDHEIIELRVKASNGSFSGKTEVYEIPECLNDFAEKLANYTKSPETLLYKPSIRTGFQFFSMKYYFIDNIEKFGIEINIESQSECFQDAKEYVKFEFFVEQSAIDNFQKELHLLAKKENGIARLIGIDKEIQ